MLPDIWGKYAWNFIHLVTMDYPENPKQADVQNYRDFLHSLQYVLPCAKCRTNLIKHFKKYPLTDEVMSSRQNLVKWGINLHNIVNYYLGKPMLTLEQANKELSKLLNPKPPKSKTFTLKILIVIVILVFIVLLCFFASKNKKLNI